MAPETCSANDERNKEYSVHLVGPELNICYQYVRNHKHKKNGGNYGHSVGRGRGVYRVLMGKPEGKNHWGDPGVDGRIIL
jgi:hypothetical protein